MLGSQRAEIRQESRDSELGEPKEQTGRGDRRRRRRHEAAQEPAADCCPAERSQGTGPAGSGWPWAPSAAREGEKKGGKPRASSVEGTAAAWLPRPGALQGASFGSPAWTNPWADYDSDQQRGTSCRESQQTTPGPEAWAGEKETIRERRLGSCCPPPAGGSPPRAW